MTHAHLTRKKNDKLSSPELTIFLTPSQKMARPREAPVGVGEAASLLVPGFQRETYAISPPGVGTRGDGGDYGVHPRDGSRTTGVVSRVPWCFALLAVATASFIGTMGTVTALHGSWNTAPRLDLPLLGALQCDNAFSVPPEAPSDRFSYPFMKLASLADQVYLLCVDCDNVVAPAAWRGKVRLVNGRVIDECVKDGDLDHWHRASFSHAVAVAHASANGHDVVAIVEDDARSDFTVNFSDDEYDRLERLIRPSYGGVSDETTAGTDNTDSKWSWNFLRFGYRPFAIEQANENNPESKGSSFCPEQCSCTRTSHNTCLVSQSGCDLRSSEAYLVNRGVFSEFTHRLQGGVVDYDVLQSFDNMMVLTPMVSYQEKLDISMDSQRDLQRTFGQVCAQGEMPAGVPTLRSRSPREGLAFDPENQGRGDFPWDVKVLALPHEMAQS